MRCSGKIRYRDRIGALLALCSTSKNDHRREKNERRAYRCPECRGWHLTSMSKAPHRPDSADPSSVEAQP